MGAVSQGKESEDAIKAVGCGERQEPLAWFKYVLTFGGGTLILVVGLEKLS